MRLLAALLVVGFAAAAHGQVFRAFTDVNRMPPANDAVGARPLHGVVVPVDVDALSALADKSPLEQPALALEKYGLRLALPDPCGAMVDCFAAASPVMEPALAAKFPGIRTIIVRSADGRASGRMELSQRGLTAMLRTPDGTWMIDAWSPGDPKRVVA